MFNLKMYVFNTNGMGTMKEKRLAIFEKFRNKKAFVLLQETHSTSQCEKKWEDEWGQQILFSHGTSNSNGVAILTPHSADYHHDH